MTLFMLPTNFRDSLLAALPAGPRWAIYGSLPHLTGLRPEQWLPAASEEAVARHVEAARRRGIPFYYALNYTCFGAQEFTAQWQRWVVELLAWLEGIGAEGVIVASPYLAELVKRRSTLRLHVSLGAQVDSVPKVLYWQEVGADAILVSQIVTQKNIHVQHLTKLIELLEAEGVRERFVLVVGGPRINNAFAKWWKIKGSWFAIRIFKMNTFYVFGYLFQFSY